MIMGTRSLESPRAEISDNDLSHMAELFKVLGDPTRMRILFLISAREINVSDMAEKLNVSESAVSHHLKILRLNRLVRRRRDGKSIYYELKDNHVRAIIERGQEHILER